jgi:ABC-type transporter Mla subunit MlaD
LVASLSEQIDDLSDVVNQSVEELDAAVKRITAAETGLADAQTDATSALSQAKKAVTAAEDAGSKVDVLTTTVEQVSSAVTQVQTKLVKISDDGTYTGTITPAQFSRKLTALDLAGDWPLDRTSGDLDSAKLKAPTFGCWPDSRYNTVVTFDGRSRIACIRLPK